MKKKWWILLTAFILVFALAAGFFWDAITIRVAPKVVLTKALTTTISALRERVEGSPLSVLSRGLDREGKNTISLDLETSNQLLGDIRYTMNVQTENAPRRILAEGLVTSSGGILDLSLYLDGDFAAVSSKSLLEGNYYGITYDTFSQDIRKNSLLALLIGEETISGWESSLSGLRETMNSSYEMPEFSQEDIQSVLAGILALKAQVSRDTVTVNGAQRRCHKVTFSAIGPEIAAAAQEYLPQLSDELRILVEQLKNDPESTASASFSLWKGAVVKAECSLFLQGKEQSLCMSLGADAAKDDIFIETAGREEGKLEKRSVTVSTTYDASTYKKKLEIVQIENGVQDRTFIDYSWDRTSGAMGLHLTEGGEDIALDMNLQGTGEGFRLSTDQFEVLMGLLTDQENNGNSSCTMTVTKGASFDTPAYKNFDQWSMEDLLALLGGLGSLIGLKIG